MHSKYRLIALKCEIQTKNTSTSKSFRNTNLKMHFKTNLFQNSEYLVVQPVKEKYSTKYLF
jgi:hypothetical protein